MGKLSWMSEQTEVDTAIATMLHKTGMRGEFMVLAVFKDKHATWSHDVLLHNEVGNRWQFLQRIGWICKDKVKLLSATLQETEHITTDTLKGGRFQS